MKILTRKKIQPIRLRAGDSLSVTYRPPYGREQTLDTYTAVKGLVVDDIMIFELGKKELEKLGLRKSLGVILGESV